MRATAQASDDLSILLRDCLAHRLAGPRQIAMGMAIRILLFSGLHICFPLFLLAWLLLCRCIVIYEAALARKDISIFLTLRLVMTTDKSDGDRCR